MEKSEFRVLIKHYFLRGKSINETEEKFEKYYKESASSHVVVHKWFTEFRCGRISTSDAERPGRPKEVTSQEMRDKIHDIVLNVHGFLGMRKRSARWVPRLLTADHKIGLVWLRLSNV